MLYSEHDTTQLIREFRAAVYKLSPFNNVLSYSFLASTQLRVNIVDDMYCCIHMPQTCNMMMWD